MALVGGILSFGIWLVNNQVQSQTTPFTSKVSVLEENVKSNRKSNKETNQKVEGVEDAVKNMERRINLIGDAIETLKREQRENREWLEKQFKILDLRAQSGERIE